MFKNYAESLHLLFPSRYPHTDSHNAWTDSQDTPHVNMRKSLKSRSGLIRTIFSDLENSPPYPTPDTVPVWRQIRI
jgi:hypothetical protein